MRVNVTIRDWSKYNPRTDRVNFSWLRFENNYFSNPRIFSLRSEVQRLHIFCLCEASKKNIGVFELNTAYAASILKIPEETILSGMEEMRELELLDYEEIIPPAKCRQNAGGMPAAANITPSYETIRDDTERNETKFLEEEKIEVDPQTPMSRDLDPDPIPEIDVVVPNAKEMLKGITPKVQRIWANSYGLDVVNRELPLAYAKYQTDEVRQRDGGYSLYLANWFGNAKRDGPRREKPAEKDFMQIVKEREAEDDRRSLSNSGCEA